MKPSEREEVSSSKGKHMMRKTKIVVTLGPASNSEDTIERLVKAGADAFRFNFSHGTKESHLETYRIVRSVTERMGRNVALIQDLQGPKIRVGELEGGEVDLETGREVVLTSRREQGNQTCIRVVYDHLEQDVQPGEMVLMDDGKLRLEVLRVGESGLTCGVVEGGILRTHKGVNFPGTILSMPSLTNKDMEDLRFGLQLGFDAVALSFVSQAADVISLRDEMKRVGTIRPIIAKLERAACLNDLPAILKVSDAVMVARGDLGVEVDIKRVPVLQKTIINQANIRGIPVITATQMLESMTAGLLPTRAEAADVANAVYDGTDALMLSGETSVGLYPVQAVDMMREIALEAEAALETGAGRELWTNSDLKGDDIAGAICHTAVVAAHDLGLSNIVAITRSGRTALDISKFRPHAAIHAFSFNPEVSSFLSLSRGVAPHLSERSDDVEALMDLIDSYMLERGIGAVGEAVAVVLGVPIGTHKSTNMLMIHRLGQKMAHVRNGGNR